MLLPAVPIRDAANCYPSATGAETRCSIRPLLPAPSSSRSLLLETSPASRLCPAGTQLPRGHHGQTRRLHHDHDFARLRLMLCDRHRSCRCLLGAEEGQHYHYPPAAPYRPEHEPSYLGGGLTVRHGGHPILGTMIGISRANAPSQIWLQMEPLRLCDEGEERKDVQRDVNCTQYKRFNIKPSQPFACEL